MMIVLTVMLRLIPHLLAPMGAGVDHWYWKAYIEEYKRTKIFPPEMRQFRLEEKQWYPPLFALFISKLPLVLYEKYSHLLAIGIDTLRLFFLISSAYLITGRVNSIFAAGIVYALTPILISYNIQLNPRGLGALLLDILILLLIWLIWHDGIWWAWLVVIFISGLILLTHKMTTQLFWFMCLASSVIFMDWRLLALIPLSITSAMIISRGFYLKVLYHHWDIVTFWNRHWRWLSVHPVRESPIYGDQGFETSTKYFLSGLRGQLRRAQYIIGFSPWAWSILVASLWIHWSDSMLTNEDLWLMQWLGIILLFIILTTFVPIMRCLGNGYLYGYNASFPAALLVAMIWGGLKHTSIINGILLLTLVAAFFGIGFYFWTINKSKTLKIEVELNNLLQYLRKKPPGLVMSYPQHWHDLVAYKTNKDVLFGGHGFGFKMLEPIFPRMLKPIDKVIAEYNVRYLLTYDKYLPNNFIADFPKATVKVFGLYHLYEFNATETM